MRVLGIETSCDETGVAIYEGEQQPAVAVLSGRSLAGRRPRGRLLGQALFSQVAIHADYGGVVPELASRDHVRKLLPLIREVFQQAGCSAVDIDGVAYTSGPGLMGALMVGACAGRSLAYAWGVPAIAVHHMEGHLLAPMLEEAPPQFPFVALLVSGGHTQLVRVDGIGEYELLGESLDDAAGEAFDKAAKMLGLGYPGGPEIAKLAQSAKRAKNAKGDHTQRFRFPRPMVDRPGLDFSFSGLKTFTLNTVAEHALADGLPDVQTCADIACAFQEAVVETLVIKCRRALEQTKLQTLIIAGGVSANNRLREALQTALAKVGAQVFYARHEFCTDNGAMIAFAGCQRLMAGQKEGLGVAVKARWPLQTLPALGPGAPVLD